MTEFQHRFLETFGEEWPGAAIELSLPRLRFELAPEDQADALKEAESRCLAIYNAAFENTRHVWVEIVFHDRHQQNAFAKLRAHGLDPITGAEWQYTKHTVDEAEEHRYSARVPVKSRGFEYLFRAVVLADHGTLEQVCPRVLILDPEAALGYWPYDDRGADLFAREAAALRPLCDRFDSWILSYDRSRIESELSGR